MKIINPDQVQPEEVNAPLFTDTVTRQVLLSPKESDLFDVAVVNFRKGVKNKFHTHTSDQILIVTAGRGIVATEDEERVVTVGDVIQFPAGERHWHGATDDSDFSHVAIKHISGDTQIAE